MLKIWQLLCKIQKKMFNALSDYIKVRITYSYLEGTTLKHISL